ncbi:MAG TPA: tRNA guanosine(34) transglycosylase Tgt, partial [Smithellaceae bacterium]|nr:tRNA guanosine(34) transglycosylase Tgt [Smithellaceae bacterium]
MNFKFDLLKKDRESQARLGMIQTAHGVIKTPVFMPVGTQGTVKSLLPEQLQNCGASVILANTYHLYLRPGQDLIKKLGGLHNFMNWQGPLLTDSGGFQVFSLGALRKITAEGVIFNSHIDGSRHLLTPQKAIAIQEALGSDIMMCLDDCTPYPATFSETQKSLDLTAKWSKLCKQAKTVNDQALFGIVQGGTYLDLRRESLEKTVALDFAGYALGGVSVGEPKEIMYDIADQITPLLPPEKPRYLMGVGTPWNILES